MSSRIQLSLFVAGPTAAVLESARCTLDPVQSNLIPAHVTLCREDELASLENGALLSRLADLPVDQVTLHFGRPEAFHEHGILLPCIAGEEEFIAVREHILGSCSIRHQSPHITLAHPRNPKAPGNSLVKASELPETITIVFSRIHLIEQTGTSRWRVVGTFDLPNPWLNELSTPIPRTTG
jgi:2'-5' RNA ligase